MRRRVTPLNDLFDEAAKLGGARNNVPHTVSQMMHGPLWDRLTADIQTLKHVAKNGLQHLYRDHIKLMHDTVRALEDEAISEPMLALWPKRDQPFIAKINRAVVFVPSVGEHVDMLPDAITPAQEIEAGEYLIQHGTDAIDRGKTLIKHGKMRGA